MTVWRKKSNGRWAASVSLHVGVFDSEAEGLEAVQETWDSKEVAALRAWLREQYGDNHGGYRTGERRGGIDVARAQ